jgi:hypothetical protein
MVVQKIALTAIVAQGDNSNQRGLLRGPMAKPPRDRRTLPSRQRTSTRLRARVDRLDEGSGKWRRVRVEEERDALDGRGDLLERFQPFSAHREFEIEESGDVAARPRHTGDEAAAERINDVHEQDWDGVRFLHERGYRRRGMPTMRSGMRSISSLANVRI